MGVGKMNWDNVGRNFRKEGKN